jgi:Subtilase family
MQFVQNLRSQRSPRGGTRLVLVAILSLALASMSSCGGGGSTQSACVHPQKDSTTQPHCVIYWIPGVFIVGLESSTGGLQHSPAAILANVTATLNTALLGTGLSVAPLNGSADAPGITPTPPPGVAPAAPPALMVFDTVAIASFQLVSPVAPNGPDLSDLDLQKAVNTVNTSVGPVSNNTDIWIVGAAPDLVGLGGSAGDHIGGSPDGRPAPAKATSKWNTASGSAGSDYTVFVLDTAAAPGTDLCLKYAGPQNSPQSSTATCDFLNIEEDTKFALPESLVADAYPYSGWSSASPPLPTDLSFKQHGQFVAKIFQHQAPGAKLLLIRVLNDFGAADVRSLLYGLYQVYTLTQGNPAHTVVNMSLSIEPPTACLPTIWDTWTNQDNPFRNQSTSYEGDGPTYPVTHVFDKCPKSLAATISTLSMEKQRLFLPLGLVVEKLVKQSYQLVVAAGNDSAGQPSTDKFGPDMPAAFCGALAVAATDAQQVPKITPPSPTTLAVYSNDPSKGNGECLGISTGFDSTGVPDTKSTPVQVSVAGNAGYALGTKVCSLDQDSSTGNSAQMGLWDGTSFATPFVSALIASGGVAVSGEQPCDERLVRS